MSSFPFAEDEGALLRLIQKYRSAHRRPPPQVWTTPREIVRMLRACNPFGATPTMSEMLNGVRWWGARVRGGIWVVPDLDSGPLPDVV